MEDGYQHVAYDDEVYGLACLACDGGYLALLEATGVDELEGAEVVGDVEREAVHRHIAATLDAYGRDLALPLGVADIEPDAGRTLLQFASNTIEAQELYDRALQQLYVGAQPEAEALEVKDRVARDLARAVVGHVAAALDLIEVVAHVA